jgi:TolA-binding protein
LKASRVERWLHALGSDYDQMSTQCEGDEALLRRVVQNVAGQGLATPRPRRRRFAVALVGVGGFVTLGAAALTLPRMTVSPKSEPQTQCVECPEPRQDVALVGQRREAVAEPAGEESAAPAGADSVPRVARAVSKGAAAQVAPKSAAEQFAEANQLRKSGRIGAAVAAYRRLQHQHPGSSQARLSHVLLGRILLQQGSAGPAHAQFSSYLRSSPGGSLAEEALHGQATALRRSGRTAEERQVWRTLIARFPQSIYARRARERLRELD